MAKLCDLPVELIELIVECLGRDPHAICQFARCGRLYHNIASPLLRRFVVIRNHHGSDWGGILTRLVEMADDVRWFSFHFYYDSRPSACYLPAIDWFRPALEAFHSLKSLTIRCSNYCPSHDEVFGGLFSGLISRSAGGHILPQLENGKHLCSYTKLTL